MTDRRGRSTSTPTGELRVSSRNASFQQWQALLANRRKRNRAREFLVQGVRPIELAVRNGWTVRVLLLNAGADRSRWADEVVRRTGGRSVLVSAELMHELGEKEESAPEVLAVVEMPPDALSRIDDRPDLLTVVFDRPASPGNLGTLIRSADAFGAGGVVVTGHAADPYDPRAVRASTGSLFGVPVVRVPSHREVLDWVGARRDAGIPVQVVGSDEQGDVELDRVDLTGPTVLVVGNEHAGLTAAWRESCDRVARIPMQGTASSLNAAAAGTVLLYEAHRRRRSGSAGG